MFGFTSEIAGSAIRYEQYGGSRFAEIATTLPRQQEPCACGLLALFIVRGRSEGDYRNNYKTKFLKHNNTKSCGLQKRT
jgi:hypothetical protein